MFQLDSVGWRLSLEMGSSDQAKTKTPKATVELGIKVDDGQVRYILFCSHIRSKRVFNNSFGDCGSTCVLILT